MLLKSHLGIKCHFQYIKVIRLLQHSSANIVNAGDWGCVVRDPDLTWTIVRDLGTIIVLILVLLAFNLVPSVFPIERFCFR